MDIMQKLSEMPSIFNASGDWNDQRRDELFNILIENVFGRIPPAPIKTEYKEYTFNECIFDEESFDDPTKEMHDWFGNENNARFKKVRVICHLSENDFPGLSKYPEAEEKFEFDISCYIPNLIDGEKVPAIAALSYRETFDNSALPMKEIVEQKVAVFAIRYRHIVNDYPERNNPGRIHPQFNDTGLDRLYYGDYRLRDDHTSRKNDEPGTIAMWAWGASRVMDYIQTQGSYIDLNKVAVSGFSRLGKTSLLAGAADTRFTHVLSHASCAAGASLTHIDTKETLKSVSIYPEWFCENLQKCCENPPFDMHYLLGCIAPRKIYISNSDNDVYCDQNAEYLSCVLASKIYEKLGETGFIHPDRLPEVGDVFHEGNIAYHLREGAHAFILYDWMKMIEFLSL